MSNLTVFIVLCLSALVTAGIRMSPIFIKLPENNSFINKFFEGIPYVVLTILIFPDIFTSMGAEPYHISKTIIAMIGIFFLAIKKVNLAFIIIIILTSVFIYDYFLLSLFS